MACVEENLYIRFENSDITTYQQRLLKAGKGLHPNTFLFIPGLYKLIES